MSSQVHITSVVAPIISRMGVGRPNLNDLHAEVVKVDPNISRMEAWSVYVDSIDYSGPKWNWDVDHSEQDAEDSRTPIWQRPEESC